MAITVTCSCGQELRVKDEFAGRRLKCPTCERMLVVPGGRGGAARRRPGDSRRARSRPRRSWPLIAGSVGVGVLVLGGLVALLSTRSTHGHSGSAGAPWRPEGNVARWARQLQAPTIRQRAAAARALATLGPRAAEAVPELMRALGRRSAAIEVQVAAGKALEAIGRAAVPPLVRALGSADGHTRFTAARALGKLGPKAAEAVPHLIAVLRQDREDSVRASAATALGEIGAPAATKAIPALRQATGDPNTPFSGNPERDSLRVAAQTALRKIRGDW